MASLQPAVRDRKAKLEAIIFDLGGTLIFFDGAWGDVVLKGDLRLMQAVQAAGMSVDEKTFPIRFRTQLQDYYVERETEFIEYTTAYILRQVLAEYGYLHADEKGLWLSDGEVSQRLSAVYPDSHGEQVTVVWAGDLDGDGLVDLVLDDQPHYALICNYRLFLSSEALGGMLVREVAWFGAVAC